MKKSSASGATVSRLPVRSLSLRPDDSLTILKMALSISSQYSVSFLLTLQVTGHLTLTLVGLIPTECASLCWTRRHAGLSWRTPHNFFCSLWNFTRFDQNLRRCRPPCNGTFFPLQVNEPWSWAGSDTSATSLCPWSWYRTTISPCGCGSVAQSSRKFPRWGSIATLVKPGAADSMLATVASRSKLGWGLQT